MFSQRLRLFQIIIYLSFLLLIAALFFFQIFRYSHYKSLSLKNTIRIIPIEASRGTIYDRNGEVLAKDDISFDLVVIPQEIENIDKTISRLSRITGIDKNELLKNYKKNYYLPFVPVKLFTNLSAKDAFSIEERLFAAPGALIHTEPRRSYPNKGICSHAIGYIGRIARDEFERLRDYGYKMEDMVGKSGIEKYYDAYLKGENGGIQIEVDAMSREVRRLGFKEPKEGKDLKLTIDLGLQRFLNMLLEEKAGSCIVMYAKTGEVLGLVSSPGFDPNIFSTGTNKEKTRALKDSRSPFLNRAIGAAYPPGSTFKIVVASAGVATSTVKDNTAFNCSGIFRLGKREFRCWKESGHGYQNIVDGLTHSCNIFFYNLGRALGAEQIYRYALQFGMGSPTGIDLPDEAKGLAPGPLWKRFVLKAPWYEGDTINYSIGQGYLLVTPMQMLKAVTIVANEGYCPTPYLAEEIEGRRLSSRKSYIARLKSDTFKIVKRGLYNSVNDPTGTGQNAKLKDLGISGKTGTAQPGTSGNTHAWFVGYFPSDDPKISVVVFLEHGGHGGVEPARMVKLIATYLKKNGFLE